MGTELTTTDFQQLDRLDEEQILAELQGAVLDQYVYSFKSGGRQVTGLSWAGVKHIASRMGGVQCDLLQLTDTGDAYLVVVKATAPDGASRIGAAEQPKVQKTRGGEQPDPFALPKAVSKAQRNAIRALLPESLIAEVIKMHQQQPARRPASKAKTPEPARWTHNTSTVARMFDEAKKIGLSQSDVHLALLVEDVREFTGTKAEAWKMIEDYAARRTEYDIPL